MDLAQILFSLAILHAGYLIQLSFRQPSSKKITTQNESWIMWLVASPLGTVFARLIILVIAAHHATVSLAMSNELPRSSDVLQTACPAPQYLDDNLFRPSDQVIGGLILLYIGSYFRFHAYAQLGTNFTYRLAKPDQLVTSGLYKYVRHPSYTGLILVLLAAYSLFFRQRGLASCWTASMAPKLVEEDWIGYVVPVVGFNLPVWLFMVKRVKEEEKMMEKEFGQKWRDYCRGTKKFVPAVY